MSLKHLSLFLAILFFLLTFSGAVAAQERLALTITPPIIKNNVNPGQIWKSYIKVVNNNKEDIDAYVQLMNFDSDGESGTVKLRPMSEADVKANEYLINNWIVVERGPIRVPANQSAEIPFIVDVPEQADPGDHHVAFLIGTMPNEESSEGSSIKVSSKLGSLLLLNVSGDVDERGEIREFFLDKDIYDAGEAVFTLRFENTGNTILLPQGVIKIYDFKNREKGAVDINRKTNTGNVFPGDVRRWQYKWPVPDSIAEMGRYRADISLSYGNGNTETVEKSVSFWVIKWKPLLSVLGIFLFIILIAVFFVRRYIKNAIIKTQEEIGALEIQSQTPNRRIKPRGDKSAVVDLKARAEISVAAPKQKVRKKESFLFKKIFLVLVTALFLIFLLFTYYYFATFEAGSEDIVELQDANEVLPLSDSE